MTSSQYGPYGQGCTRTTMPVQWEARPRGGANPKTVPSSDCRLQLAYMKEESLVIRISYDGVNTFPGLVHTARHIMKVDCTEVAELTARRQAPSMVGNWDEVVTR